MAAFSPLERRAAVSLSVVYITRMMGLFLLLPVLSILATDLADATPLLIGLTVGIYALFQALLQIPFGMLSDRLGRKPVILTGLAIFVVGSLVAAMANSIWGVILGRALQGGGAISAVVMALAADLTRDSQRTKIMAVIGASIGLSFIVSIVLGPVLMSYFDLSAIFYFIAASGLLAALLVVYVVPEPETQAHDRNVSVVVGELPAMLRNRDLLKIDFGIFLLHLLITASFVCIPLKLIEVGIDADAHWSVYLAGAFGSLLILFPMVGFLEKKLSVSRLMVINIIGLALSLAALGLFGRGYGLIVVGMTAFFGFMSVLESVLPSLVSRTAPASLRGSAMGVYSTSQFFGAFIGGLLGGWLSGTAGMTVCLVVLAALCLCWLMVASSMHNPPKLRSYRLPLADAYLNNTVSLRDTLQYLPGVAEVSVISGEKAAYLKINRDDFDERTVLKYSSDAGESGGVQS